MFCPECESEYRPELLKCPACRASLVAHLSPDYQDARGNAISDSRGWILVWSGLSRRFLASIREALDAAKIGLAETQQEFGLLPATKQWASFLWVAPQDYDKARAVLDSMFARPELENVIADEADAEGRSKPFSRYLRSVAGYGPTRKEQLNPVPGVLGSVPRIFTGVEGVDPSDFEDSSIALSPAREDQTVPDDLVEDFDPDKATVEVWSGEDREMPEYLKNCLSGVGVGCVISTQGAKAHVLVLPETEKRAREIVREVVDGTPPE